MVQKQRHYVLVYVREYTKTAKSIRRPALDQSNCNTASPAPILIERHLIKEYTEQQINKMDGNNFNILPDRYESILSAQMTKSLGKSVINLYSNVACSLLAVGNQQDPSNDLECDPFLNTAMQRFTCDLHYRFDAFLAPVSVDLITGKHYAKKFYP